jgi:hypothetical protein
MLFELSEELNKNIIELFNNVIIEIKTNNLYSKYNEWIIEDKNGKKLKLENIIDINNQEEYNEFMYTFENVDGNSGGPFKNCGKIVSFPYYNCIHEKINKKYKKKYLKDFDIQTKYDYYDFTTNRLFRTTTEYDIKCNRYRIYPSEWKWLNLQSEDHFQNYLNNYKDMYTYGNQIYLLSNEYNKHKLYRIYMNERLSKIENIMINKLNIDCWEIICDFVC